jgi:Carboxypeptidase regulatory-like domain
MKFSVGIAVVLLAATSLWAQVSSGSISGVVQDSQGAVVPNARVLLINQDQGVTARTLLTGPDGTFVFTPLPPARYSVSIEAPGFKKYVKQDVVLYAQDRIGLPPIVLELGTVGETVIVQADAAQLQTISGERSGVITGSQIVNLASSTRIFTDLLKTVPGFNADTNNANGTAPARTRWRWTESRAWIRATTGPG